MCECNAVSNCLLFVTAGISVGIFFVALQVICRQYFECDHRWPNKDTGSNQSDRKAA